MENRIASALRAAEARTEYLNLINTNFHDCGLATDPDVIASSVSSFLHDRSLRPYRPDPAGSPLLREAVAGWYRQAGMELDASSVIVTASASESYRHLFTACCRAGGTVLLPRPGYPLFEDVAERCGLEPRFYRLLAENRWGVQPEEIAALMVHDTRAVVLISPNNPTGTVIDSDAVREIGKLCARRGVALIVDEVFSEYRFETNRARSAAAPALHAELPRPGALCPETAVYTINGVSKLFAAPDLKVSWIALTGPPDHVADARERLEIENDLYLSASPINQFVAARLLDHHAEWTAALVAEVGARRDAMLAALRHLDGRHPGVVSWIEPAGGIHLPLLFESAPGGMNDEELAIELLDRHALSVHPGYLYGEEERTMIVVSYLAPEPVIREGISRLDDWISSRRTTRAMRP